MKIADVSIRRPVFAVMLIGGLVVLGAVSIPRLGIDLWPRIEFPLITVVTELRGAAPDTMEREVTEVLEEAINTIEGIRVLRSNSSDSLSLIFVEFDLEYDIRDKAQEVREKVAAVRSELPADVEPPVVDRVDPDAEPVLAVLLAGNDSIRNITEFADKRLGTRLERLAGVGSVSIVGGREREIRVWIDPLRLSGYGLAVGDVLAAVEREHVELPGGRIETPRAEYALKTEGKLVDPADFGNIVVAEHQGRVVHLRDVASVEDGFAEERTVSRLDGRRGVALLIRRQSGENTVAVVDAVRAELERMRGGLPDGYEMEVALDASIFIRSAINDVAVALAVGAALAAAVVLVFLRNLRATLIVGVTIPSSLIASFVFFYAFGFTINTMTLMALSLCIGLLIDDAVVVLENVYRHMERGEEPAEAASRGTDEIGLAVVATTLAVCAVFVPIAFLSGVVGRFFREFGIVASCAVALSTLVAVSLTPMLCARYVRVQRSPGAAYRTLERGYSALEGFYRRILAWGLRHRPSVVALALLSVLAGGLLLRSVPVDFVIAEDRSEFNVWLKMPLGSTLDQTRTTAAAVERSLLDFPEVSAVFTTIGSGAKKRVNEAQIYVKLVPKADRSIAQQAFMDVLRTQIGRMELPLDDYAVEEISWIQVAGSRHADIMYSVRGPDMAKLQYYAANMMERMRRAGGYADVYLSYEIGKPEVALEITRERAADLGVPASQIGQTVTALYAGVEATTFEEDGERYDVRVQIRPDDRDDLSELELVRVRGRGGALVPLRNLVAPRIGSGPVQIDRENRSRVVTIYGNLYGKAAGTADTEIVGFAKSLGIEGEYEFEAVGPSKRLRETVDAVVFAFGMALLAIYMILAAQFDSFVHPITIMLCAPLSFAGSFLALSLSGSSLDVMGQIAFLMLMGIVMKNGILLVDYTNTLREKGLALEEAVLEAGPTRMRPVLMTAVSTVFGMLPVAFGTGDGSEWRNPMGLIAIGGLCTSTLLTLIVVPIAYTLVDDAQRLVMRAGRALRGGPAPG
ncbi:MAG: efflux RND transporter permease subunit [Myxococcota bacterium]